MQFHDLILRCDDKNADGSRKKCPTKGYFYEVYLNGERIARSQTNAETDACRELLRRGLKGKARFWRAGKNTHDLEMDVERGAAHVLIESATTGLHWRPYREFPKVTPWRTHKARKDTLINQRQPTEFRALA